MLFDLSAFQLTGILLAYVFAATAKGVTGLGFSTTCLPILALIVGLKDALAFVLIPSVCSNLVVMHQVGRFKETLRRFWPMLLALVPGLALGLWILSGIDGVQAGAVLGIILLLWCAFSLAAPEMRLPAAWERPLAPLSGCLTGVINGVTGSQVIPSVPFLMALHLERNLFIQALNCSFTLSSLVMGFGLGQLGLFSSDHVLISACGTIFVFFGLRMGSRIRHRLPENVFRHAIIAMLAIMGLSLMLPVVF